MTVGLVMPMATVTGVDSPAYACTLLVNFDGYRGMYVLHCHNLEHEDMQMMGNFQVT